MGIADIMEMYLAGNYGMGKVREKHFPDLPHRQLTEDEMDVYLAGIQGGKSRGFVIDEAPEREDMNIYVAGIQGIAKGFVLEALGDTLPSEIDTMNLYLAGNPSKGDSPQARAVQDNRPYILESFYYIRKQEEWYKRIQPFLKGFMLDSGAFTYMGEAKNHPDWDAYIEEYAGFVNRLGIELFFELDIDSVVGLPEVERLRDKLESLTGRQCIPVWHKSRGLDYWKRMIAEYRYVAVGGIVTGEIKKHEYGVFTPLLKMARAANAKVHGLGFTNLEGLRKYPFDSVDSTAWLYGNRGGFLYQFNGTSIIKIEAPESGMRLNGRVGAVHNFNEWCKFARYAEENL